MERTAIGTVLLAALVVAGTTAPAVALAPSDGGTWSDEDIGAAAEVAAQENASRTDASVNVTVGQQLSTVIGVSSDEIRTDFENTAFELSVETENESERAEAVADRAGELRDRAEDIREDYETATAAFEDGDIDRSAYAQRLAALNARATSVRESYDRLRSRTGNVSALELRAAGVDRAALNAAVRELSGVSGTGMAALLTQFTGESRGEIELETENGLAIDVESEDGERSREYERPRDGDRSLTATQSDALATARGELSTVANGTWVLAGSTVNGGDGTYEFAFALRNAPARTGDAEVSVDGSSGEVFAFEEEIKARDDEDDEESDDGEREGEDGEERESEDDGGGDDVDERDDDRELGIVVTEGTPVRNATVGLRVLADGEPAGNVTVYLNDRAVGTTDASGAVSVTLPSTGEAELTARGGDAEGELEFEFGDDDEVLRNLDVRTAREGDAVTTTVRYEGAGVRNASVYANDRAVGTTNADGTVTFTLDANETDDLELAVVKGAFETELSYEVRNGTLARTEGPHRGDGVSEREARDDDESDNDDDEREDADGEREDDEEDEENDEDDDSEQEADSDEGDGDGETQEDDERENGTEEGDDDDDETEDGDDSETETEEDDSETETEEDDSETETEDGDDD